MPDTPKEDEEPPVMPSSPPPEPPISDVTAMDSSAPPPESSGDDSWELYDASEQAKKLRGIFANRVLVQPSDQHLRISFGERVEDESVYHTTIVVPIADALEFGKLITRLASASLARQEAYYREAFAAIDKHFERKPEGTIVG